ncbi:MAG: response regulator transcription factor, partial [Bacillota bacterium]|nr:response regulator transcription factor [Bacillota bacterium]
ETIIKNLIEILKEEGYAVDFAKNLSQAERLLANDRYHLLLLDISLPDGKGFSLCEKANAGKTPIIFLTASDDENLVVKGFDYGAYDYILKPFRVRELLSRIKNVLRRTSVFQIENLEVDAEKGTVCRNQQEIPLSALEYRLFMTFVNNRGILLTRSQLLEDIWDIAGDFVNDNTLTVYIKRLREKIEEDPQNPVIIKTVRGIGYRLD